MNPNFKEMSKKIIMSQYSELYLEMVGNNFVLSVHELYLLDAITKGLEQAFFNGLEEAKKITMKLAENYRDSGEMPVSVYHISACIVLEEAIQKRMKKDEE